MQRRRSRLPGMLRVHVARTLAASFAACSMAFAVGADTIVITGTGSADVIDVSTSDSPHEIFGLGGADQITGSAYADTIYGGSSNDSIEGLAGNDVIVGGPGNDVIDAGPGDDVLKVSGKSAWDTVRGGSGYDRLLGSAADDLFALRLIEGIERIDGGAGFDRIRLAGGSFNLLDLSGTDIVGIELIEGSNSHDTIIGTAGADVIVGGRGDDRISGGPGEDIVSFENAFALYSVRVDADGQTTVSDPAIGGSGTDTLSEIEKIIFADGHFQNGRFYPNTSGNKPPEAESDSVSTNEDSTLVINVLGNDRDVDGDPLTVESFTNPNHGAVSRGSNGRLIYAPKADFFGEDRFIYVVSDGAATASADVYVSVASVPDAPIANDDVVVTTKGKSISISVLANDSDADGDALVVGSVTAASHGNTSIASDGTVVYSPADGFAGDDEFRYRAVDTTGRSAFAKVSVEVRPASSADALLERISMAAEGSWLRININQFQDAWVPSEHQPITPSYLNPAKIIHAWSSMAWDSNRNHLILWGGGHGNYSGNEVYRFNANTFLWERASLPSDVIDPLGDKQYFSIDGPHGAPTSSHTYDNQEFLPNLDRFITFGGAKFNARQQFVLEDGFTRTGPYLWDPSRAGADSVGGSAGSQVRPSLFPDVIGAQMWNNRDTIVRRGIATDRPSGDFVNSTSAYVRDGDFDAILITEAPRTRARLFMYTIRDVDNPDDDEWRLVGIDRTGYGNQGAGAYDPDRRLFARTAKTKDGWGLVVWDLTSPGPDNRSYLVFPKTSSGRLAINDLHGMDFDTVRGAFVLWDGSSGVWYVEPPTSPRTSSWLATMRTDGASSEAPSQSDGELHVYGKRKSQRGVLGKWKYAADYDVFLGVINPTEGNVWLYKPRGWSPPPN